MCALQFHIPEVSDSMTWNRTVPHHGTGRFHFAADRSGRTHINEVIRLHREYGYGESRIPGLFRQVMLRCQDG
jgi:hypothetical protein